MHLGDTIGGYNFFDETYQNPLDIKDGIVPRHIAVDHVTNNIFNQDTKILDINSKTGLYPLYAAYSIYRILKDKFDKSNLDL
jgi:hypothetical protein